MSFATLNLGAFLVAQVILEKAALGFDDKLESLRSVLLNQDGPVPVIGAERCRDFKPAGGMAYTFAASFFSSCSANLHPNDRLATSNVTGHQQIPGDQVVPLASVSAKRQ